ncbi:hypothetical protein TWF718_003567 [Orbilia javanica]|uniref:MACPF domain-containing protein n=1 Tax=Orbilia javanica TaxID=47235 RepID=A0AAN8R8V2_9PEZI
MTSPKITEMAIAFEAPQGKLIGAVFLSDLKLSFEELTLANLRTYAKIPKELLFTTLSLGYIADDTKISRYMQCTPEGQAIITKGANSPSTKMVFKLYALDNNKSQTEAEDVEKKRIEEAEKKKSENEKIMAEMNKNSTEFQKAGDKKVEDASNVKPVNVIAFGPDTLLVSKDSDHAASGSSGTITRVSDITADERRAFLLDQRCFHGYTEYYDAKTGQWEHKTAIKQAWQLRPAKYAPFTTDLSNYKVTPEDPCLPSFSTMDKSGIEETITKSTWQRAMLEAGFHSTTVSTKVSGVIPSAGVGIGGLGSGDYSKSTSKAEQKKDENTQHVTIYKQPRAEVIFDIDLLDLTPECRKDILRIKDAQGAKEFFENYGECFSTRFLLGGRLYTSKKMNLEEVSAAEAEIVRIGGKSGFEVGVPGVAKGGLEVGHQRGSSSEDKDGKLDQKYDSIWSCIGGDPGKCADVRGWQTSVSDYKTWRVFDRQGIYTMQALLSHIAFPLFVRIHCAKTLKEMPSFYLPRFIDDYYDDEDLRAGIDTIANLVFYRREPVASGDSTQQPAREAFERENLLARAIENHYEGDKKKSGSQYEDFMKRGNGIKLSKVVAQKDSEFVPYVRRINDTKLRLQVLELDYSRGKAMVDSGEIKSKKALEDLQNKLKRTEEEIKAKNRRLRLDELSIKEIGEEKEQYAKELEDSIIKDMGKMPWHKLTLGQKASFAAWQATSGCIRMF